MTCARTYGTPLVSCGEALAGQLVADGEIIKHTPLLIGAAIAVPHVDAEGIEEVLVQTLAGKPGCNGAVGVPRPHLRCRSCCSVSNVAWPMHVNSMPLVTLTTHARTHRMLCCSERPWSLAPRTDTSRLSRCWPHCSSRCPGSGHMPR